MPASVGTYDLADAGRYLYVTAPKKPTTYPSLYRWVNSGLPTPEVLPSHPKLLFITFQDLISLRMIVALRTAGFSLQHIRRVHRWLQQATEYPRPFALKDLWLSEAEVFADMEGFLVSASRQGQYAMDFIKKWLRHMRRPLDNSLDMTFKRVNGHEAVSTWTPHLHVILNPLVQFGAPCIEGTRIPTKSLWSMSLGGDRPEALAESYAVPLFKVQSALEWEKKIAAIAP